MAVKTATDKIVIQSVLSTDPYMKDYLLFSPGEYYRVKATDEIIGDGKKQQIFIYNTSPELTVNPLIVGLVYEIDISAPYAKNGTVDNAADQIVALLDGLEIATNRQLELLDPPMVLQSDTALYQVGIRFICYVSRITPKKTYVKG